MLRLIILYLVLIVRCIGQENDTNNFQSLKLQEYLQKYQEIENKGGWPFIKLKNNVSRGKVDSQISLLKKRLSITGELDSSLKLFNDTFNLELEAAVKLFQKKHNLDTTAIVDRFTIQELNISVSHRIRQIKTNMKRYKEYNPRDSLYISINVAAQILRLIKKDSTILEMKVIVGRRSRKTPVFNGLLSSIDLNPFWIIPPGIMRRDILPKVKNNSEFISANNITIYQANKQINPSSINWQEVDPYSIPYTFIQNPGNKNPLGKIKFSFPNKYYVYMHDTPNLKLFEKPNRTFSSGCIRLFSADSLTYFILKREKDWTSDTIDSLISTGNNIKINLLSPIMVRVNYFTAWIDDNGNLNFARDIYRKDF